MKLGIDKILKKAAQERGKGQPERALARLKEAIAAAPREFALAREAARLCFEMGRAAEGVGILRITMKRCPEERPFAIETLEHEFAAGKQLELGEVLYDSYISLSDLDKARDLVLALAAPDRDKLLAKVRAKKTAVSDVAPDDAPRLVGLLLAEALVLSAMQDSDGVAAALDRLLDLDAGQTETVGRLCKSELRHAPECHPVQLVLGHCYLNVEQPELAAEQLVAAGADPTYRERALRLTEVSNAAPALVQARAELLLLAERFDDAQAALESLLAAVPKAEAAVRRTLERVPGAARANSDLRQLHARVLAGTGALHLAVKELQEARAAGNDPAATLETAALLLQQDARNSDLLLLHARLAVDARRWDDAAASWRTALEIEPGRAEALCAEIEAAFAECGVADVGRLLVETHVQLDQPQEAARTLRQLRDAGGTPRGLLYDLAAEVAAKYGLSANLLLVFAEAALDTQREREARAALTHYVGFPGARLPEFAALLARLLQQRPEMVAPFGRALDGLALPMELRLTLALASLDGPDAGRALTELESLAREHPELRGAVLGALEALLARDGDDLQALQLAAAVAADSGQFLAAARHLARALRAEPAAAESLLRLGDDLLARAGADHAVWSALVLALVDVRHHNLARDLCHRAAEILPPEKHGFVHAALGETLLASRQLQAAASEFESALGCDDPPVERVIAALHYVVDADAHHGYARYVLAMALLRHGGDADEALALLGEAVQHDDLLVDLALDLLVEHAGDLEAHGPAQALAGALHLRKGARTRGVACLDRALQLSPALASRVMQPLELEWDRDASNADVGLTFARALRCSGQSRRACRLLAELARRFPDQHARWILELETVLAREPLPEAHRALWEILIERGEREAALQQMVLAVDAAPIDDDARRELLEVAHRQMPDSPWVVCRLAELEACSGVETRAEELLRGLLERTPTPWETVRTSLHAGATEPLSERLQLLDVDCLLAGERGGECLEVLRRFRAAFPTARDAAIERYRRLVAMDGGASPAADLDLGLLLKEAGLIDEAVATLEAGLLHAEAEPSVSGDAGAGSGANAGSDTYPGNGTYTDVVTTDARVDSVICVDSVTNGDSDVHSGDSAGDRSTDRELRLALASLYVELGREREGKLLLASVLDNPGDHREAYGFLARVSHQSTMAKLKRLRDTISRSPGNLRARLELARLSLVSLDFDAAREVLRFVGDSPAVEATRLYLLARSWADEDRPHLGLAVLRSIELDDVGDQDLRRNILYLKAQCCDSLGRYGEAHPLYLQLLSEFPGFKDTRERARLTYQRHLETALETRAEVLQKHTKLDETFGGAR